MRTTHSELFATVREGLDIADDEDYVFHGAAHVALKNIEERLEAAQRVALAADNPAVFDVMDDVALYAAHKELGAALDAWRASQAKT